MLPPFVWRTGASLALVVSLCGCVTNSAQPIPVQVGGYADDDACLAVGKIIQGPVAVHAGPSPKAEVVDTLADRSFVWMCDTSGEGSWIGILFSHRRDGRLSCGVSGTIPVRKDYDGPCREGWVPAEAIVAYAG